MNHVPSTVPRFLTSVVLAAAALGGFPDEAPAATIGVNFGGTAFGTLNPADVAGVAPYAQAGWNNVSAAATNLALNDSFGAPTTVTLTTTGAANFGTLTANMSGPDEILNSTRAVSTAPTWSFTLSGIPYAEYIVIVYGIQTTAGTVLAIGAGGTTYYTSSPQYNGPGYIDNNPNTPFTYTRSTSTDSSAPTPLSNYVLFSGLSGASQTVTISGVAGATRIGGFQIVQVPEPSTWAMVALGGGLLLGARRSLRRARP